MTKTTKFGIVILLCAAIYPIVMSAYPAEAYYDLNKIDAVLILPDDTPLTVYTTPSEPESEPEHIAPIETLRMSLANDTTDHRQYICSGDNMYICVNFATDLAQNLTDAGYDAGIVVRSAKWHNQGTGHLLTWVEIEGELFVIEAGNDGIWISDDYNATIDTEIYVMRYESLESGYRKCNEMYQRR